MNNKVKRPFLTAGAIVSLCMFIAMFAVMSYVLIPIYSLIFEATSEKPDPSSYFSFILLGGILIIFLLGIISSIFTLVWSKVSPEKFRKKQSAPIATIIFALISVIYCIVVLCSSSSNSALILPAIIFLILASIFMIIDISKNKKLLKENNSDVLKTEINDSNNMEEDKAENNIENKIENNNQ